MLLFAMGLGWQVLPSSSAATSALLERLGKTCTRMLVPAIKPMSEVTKFMNAAACAVALVLTACSGSSGHGGSYGSGDPNLAAANPGGGPIDPFLSDGSAVTRALDAIAAHSGKPLR